MAHRYVATQQVVAYVNPIDHSQAVLIPGRQPVTALTVVLIGLLFIAGGAYAPVNYIATPAAKGLKLSRARYVPPLLTARLSLHSTSAAATGLVRRSVDRRSVAVFRTTAFHVSSGPASFERKTASSP
jgi:hypothetical protein